MQFGKGDIFLDVFYFLIAEEVEGDVGSFSVFESPEVGMDVIAGEHVLFVMGGGDGVDVGEVFVGESE